MPAAACTPESYRKFRTGLDFGSVREILAVEQAQAKAAGLYMFVSRGTVLGRLMELKERAYTEYVRAFKKECEADPFRSLGVEQSASDIF